ncbi:hypothetical protein SNE40_021142 [Patella caerulea]|uniref:Uncharacterized protein n=1 Tax=Patella caerulea TaxID=87958 RepID=A0AAN8FYW0_PATCE
MVEHDEFWISLFKQLKIDGHYSGSFIDKSLVQFCFMEIVQKELDDIFKVWNYHRIRPTQYTTNGRPCILYNAPELFDTHDCLILVRDYEVSACFEKCVCHKIPCDQEIYQLANLYIAENSLKKPTDAYEALNLYMFLRNLFQMDL